MQKKERDQQIDWEKPCPFWTISDNLIQYFQAVTKTIGGLLMIRHTALLFVTSIALTFQCPATDDRLIPKLDDEVDLLIQATQQIDGLDKYVKRLNKTKEDAAGGDSKKQERAVRKLEEVRLDLLAEEGFPEAYRNVLHKEFGISPDMIRDEYPSPEEVEKAIKERISKHLNAKYPSSELIKLNKQANKIYAPYKVGDRVEVVVNGRKVSGRINSMTPTTVMIGSNRLNKRDLNPKFSEDKMRKLQREYVDERFTEPRGKYHEMLQQKTPSLVYKESGYVNFYGNWMPAAGLQEMIEKSLAVAEAEAEVVEAAAAKRMLNIKIAAIFVGAIVVLVILLVVARVIREARESDGKKRKR